MYFSDTLSDGIAELENIVEFWKNSLEENFSSACVLLGAVPMALHYEILSAKFGNVAVPFIVGEPSTGKSKTVEMAVATLGVEKNYHGILISYIRSPV